MNAGEVKRPEDPCASPRAVLRPVSGLVPAVLAARLQEARQRLDALAACLTPDSWLGPRAPHLNPPLWEYGHIAWFQERWCLRLQPDGSLADSRCPGADALYDSSAVPHDTRWDLPLPDPAATRAYGEAVLQAVARRLAAPHWEELPYFAELSLYHELMHIEAWWMAWQNLGYAAPVAAPAPPPLPRVPQRLAFEGGSVALGARPDEGFIFDNEKWCHGVVVAGFDIDATPVTEDAFAEFLAAGGYANSALWSAEGRRWLSESGARHPWYWRGEGSAWEVRRFERWGPVIPGAPLLHVNRFEAEAYAAWRGRRLPRAAEWVRAAAHPDFRWGHGWEWTADPFLPYPGFAPDPYADYSRPWFESHWELRGGGPWSDAALKRPGYRNFYLPHRRDPFAGLRTAGSP